MTEAEVEARLAEFAGRWVLDESGSSPQISAPQPPREHTANVVGSEGQVNAVLEVVNGRLRMTRTMRIFGETVAPLVLWYDREGGRTSG